MTKRTLVLGASPNPARFAHKTVKSLVRHNIEVVPIGIKHGIISDVNIMVGRPSVEKIHTVTMYLKAENQIEYYDYIKELEPNRIIFNPGAENPELEAIANENNIEVLRSCTIVMLNNGSY